MKKIILPIFIALILFVIYAAWNIIGPTVHAPAEKYFYIKTGEKYDGVVNSLKNAKVINSTFFFKIIAKRVKYDQNVKPGRYEINNGSNILDLIRMLKGGRQSPVKLVINKIRTKEDLAGKIGNAFEADSAEVMNFIMNKDSLAPYHLDTNTVMTMVIPNTYLVTWNGNFKKVFKRLLSEHDQFWTKERSAKAATLGLSPDKVYTLASIIEEETNKKEDKGLIASVYLNRIRKGMKLEADPTVKYAMRNFGLKRILHGHLAYQSPYNTYLNTGLPPGPICTASMNTIDAVLNAPPTNYIFFVAKPDFGGYSNFAESYAEHLFFAKAYQKALDSLIISKKIQ